MIKCIKGVYKQKQGICNAIQNYALKLKTFIKRKLTTKRTALMLIGLSVTLIVVYVFICHSQNEITNQTSQGDPIRRQMQAVSAELR